LVAFRLVAHGEVTAISLQSPNLTRNGSTNLTSPIHVQATAEDTATITGYVVYVDGVNVFRNFSPSVDAWISLPSGSHALYIRAWDAGHSMTTGTYRINVVGFAPPAPPVRANRTVGIDGGTWTADNDRGVGGNCNHGSLRQFLNSIDPNTDNLPGPDGPIGQHFMLASGCTYDDGLFYRKYAIAPGNPGRTNFLCDFWFQALPFHDGVHEFMFGSQCNYATNRWQLWLPHGADLTWVDAGTSPCRTTTGTWHHLTYYLQRVMPTGYQEIPNTFGPATDRNTSLRFVTLTMDGQTIYLGGVAWSTIPQPAWGPVVGVQHQLDSAVSGAILEEYANGESLTSW
jgi:hypothetical protein